MGAAHAFCSKLLCHLEAQGRCVLVVAPEAMQLPIARQRSAKSMAPPAPCKEGAALLKERKGQWDAREVVIGHAFGWKVDWDGAWSLLLDGVRHRESSYSHQHLALLSKKQKKQKNFYLVADPCFALLRNSRSVGHTVHALAEPERE